MLTEEQKNDIWIAKREWGRKGHPDKAALLAHYFDREEMPPNDLMSFGDIKPEKRVDVLPEMPARAGRGATKKLWKEFALATIEIEEEILERMTRDEIVMMLETKKVIPREEETE